MSDLFSLKGRVILVTGSSAGMGLAMARAMADAGGLVVLNARGRDKLEQAARSLRDAGHQAEIEPFDVADEVTAASTSWSAMPASSTACRSTSSPPKTFNAS